ncbi:hypothetical protein D3C76_1605330 [compost metagenome]
MLAQLGPGYPVSADPAPLHDLGQTAGFQYDQSGSRFFPKTPKEIDYYLDGSTGADPGGLAQSMLHSF